ncbi:CREC-EF hand family protein [Pseudomonas taeanensis]|uniref:hypothetical protein n=1 Tax=Pseudomonas taeanensis TaxID=574962 RepID=UPI0009FAAF94|nr:hypothetical protein [Pseudomonas taeanensis]
MKKLFVPIVVLSAAALLMGCSADGSDRHGSKGGHLPSPERLLKELDSDNDGVLSREEVKGPLADHFGKVDANKDGFLSLSELQNMPRPKGRP